MSDIQKKFYVLRAISGKENKVREYLEAELKNTDLGEYVFPNNSHGIRILHYIVYHLLVGFQGTDVTFSQRFSTTD